MAEPTDPKYYRFERNSRLQRWHFREPDPDRNVLYACAILACVITVLFLGGWV